MHEHLKIRLTHPQGSFTGFKQEIDSTLPSPFQFKVYNTVCNALQPLSHAIPASHPPHRAPLDASMPWAGVFPPLGERVVLQHSLLVGLLLGLEILVAVAPNHSAHLPLVALVFPEKGPHKLVHPQQSRCTCNGYVVVLAARCFLSYRLCELLIWLFVILDQRVVD